MALKINSRRKGAKNERDLAKLLEIWTNKKFAKTPASGGLNWKNTNVAGDIVCTTEGHYFPFCIEAKSYKDINFIHLLNPNKKGVKVKEFWDQAVRDATKANKVPLLFMRYNGMPKGLHFVMMTSAFYLEDFDITLKTTITLKLPSYIGALVLTTSTEFFKSNYKTIKKSLKKNGKR